MVGSVRCVLWWSWQWCSFQLNIKVRLGLRWWNFIKFLNPLIAWEYMVSRKNDLMVKLLFIELLLLLSHFSRVQPCTAPQTAIHWDALLIGISVLLEWSQEVLRVLLNYSRPLFIIVSILKVFDSSWFLLKCIIHGVYSWIFFSIWFLKLFIFGFSGSSLLHLGFSLVVASWGHSSLQSMGFSFQWLLLLQNTGPRAHGLQ